MRLAFAAVAITALVQLANVKPARAGTYVMRNCDVPGQPVAPMGPWTVPQPIESLAIVDNCALGDGVRFAPKAGSVPGGAIAGMEMSRPAGVRSPISFVKVVLTYATRLDASGPPLYFHVHDRRPDGDGRRPLVLEGPSASPRMTTELALSPTTTSVYAAVGCGPFDGPVPAEPCVSSVGAFVVIYGMEFTLREDAPAIVLRPAGSLLEDRAQSGIQTLTYSASDAQSGLARIDALLGGTVVASRDLSPRCAYSDFTACPTSQEETFQIDTRAVANGTYPLTLRVTDAAGNDRVVSVADDVEVTNAADASASDTSGFKLTAQFSGTARSTLSVPFGRRVVVRGRLSRGLEPVAAGTKIEVFKKLDRRGAREVSAGRVLTKAGGAFSLVLPTTRPSRTTRFVYRTSAGREVATRALKLRVRASSRVSASLRGRVVRFSGRVLSGPIPKRGKRVQMEGRSPGSKWTAFKVVRSDSKGRFSGTYRLRVRRPGVLLKVRAVVPKEDGYGYLSAPSRAVSLRVR